MEQNEKIAAIAEKDRCWAELREHEEDLSKLIHKIVEPDKITPSDFILFSQTIALVLSEIAIFEDDFSIKEIPSSDMVKHAFSKMFEDMGYMKIIGDVDVSTEKRLETLAQLRHSVWEGMVYKKDAIVDLFENLSTMDDMAHFILMLQCVSVVGLELELKHKELVLLGIDDFPEK